MSIPRIDLSNFDENYEKIKIEIIDAAKNAGFFMIYNQDSPSLETISDMFEYSKKFFDLPLKNKQDIPFIKLKNTGYEYFSQLRPSTLTVDQKESIQLQLHRQNENWPLNDNLQPDWSIKVAAFIEQCQELSMKLLRIFAEELKFPSNFFTERHDITKDTAQSTLRLLHYFKHDDGDDNDKSNLWRAGAHTDFDVLTLLFQESTSISDVEPGYNGLEVCPGRETFTTFGIGDKWTKVPAKLGDIVINIGDMLMSWSDDQFKSNFHRVRIPNSNEIQQDRYSIAWFNQANTDVLIQGPLKKYPKTTGKNFIEDAMKRNYSLIKSKEEEEKKNF
ncbi:hypothetical protein PACTADRAFT_50497 [Pachysolen tannophilus NRRL Y-2460]|uniref:Fe2OG dioxygenase domain-containing protein n=1 Tax=Pachysolen tannophilus NRRL Y-2460 TaxID=669874 RepID=A0A1E4TSB4_PACTA|nr:hypothetical protein PACTADRAFT_50497 [Pachysolen tannophilus NRRL Y-2460]